MKRFSCEECGDNEYVDIEGSGTDEYGDFQAFICECGYVTNIYDGEQE